MIPTPRKGRMSVSSQLGRCASLAGGVFLVVLGCSRSADRPAQPSEQTTTLPSRIAPTGRDSSTDDGQWIMPARNYASTRYSALDQITTQNAKQLQLAWSFSTGVTRGHEAAPLVVDNTMYIVTPFPNYLYALDLTQPGAPAKWTFKPDPALASQGVACCDLVNRGAAYWDGKIYFNSLDATTHAVDAKTGKEVWRTRVGDINKGESTTMARLVVKGKVLVGNSGGEFGVRGWLTALDGKTGKLAWRAYHTGPDKDVLIGSRFKPFYS